MSLILAAARIADLHHRGIRRKYNGFDYIVHPGRVAARISRYRFADETWVAAAWLHDTLEDPTVLGEYMRVQDLIDELMKVMPLHMQVKEWEIQVRGLVGIVIDLTNPSKQHPQLPREKRKEMDRNHIKRVSQAARCIKLADRTDNLNDMMGSPKEFRTLYIGESIDLLNALKGTAIDLETELANAIERVRYAP